MFIYSVDVYGQILNTAAPKPVSQVLPTGQLRYTCVFYHKLDLPPDPTDCTGSGAQGVCPEPPIFFFLTRGFDGLIGPGMFADNWGGVGRCARGQQAGRREALT